MIDNEKKRKMRQTPQLFSSVSNFLLRIYEFLENPLYNDIVCWKEDGQAFVVKNSEAFSNEILPQYFKHNNFASFIRQLNMYGFQKFKRDTDENEFRHKLFQRGQKNLLGEIKRKIPKCAPNASQNKMVQYDKKFYVYKARKESLSFSGDLLSMKSKQNDIEKVLKVLHKQNTQLIQENKKIWEEIAKNKDRYARKKERLMNFIYSAVQQLEDPQALVPYFDKKNLAHGDLDDLGKEANLSSSEGDENRILLSKNSKKLKANSRKSSMHLEVPSKLEFQPFNVTLPRAYSEISHTLLKPRNSPFLDSLDEDDIEPALHKQIKIDHLTSKASRRFAIENGSYDGKRIGSTNTAIEEEQTLSLAFPEVEALSPITELPKNFGDNNDECPFLDFTKESLVEIQEEHFSSACVEDNKNIFMSENKNDSFADLEDSL